LATFAQIFGESFGNSAAEEETELTEVAIKLYICENFSGRISPNLTYFQENGNIPFTTIQ